MPSSASPSPAASAPPSMLTRFPSNRTRRSGSVVGEPNPWRRRWRVATTTSSCSRLAPARGAGFWPPCATAMRPSPGLGCARTTALLSFSAGPSGSPSPAGTLISDDSPDALAHAPLAERAAPHPGHSPADRGGVRPRGVLRVLAIPRAPHHHRRGARVPAEPEPGCRSPGRLLEPAVDHRRLLRVDDDARRGDPGDPAAGRIPRAAGRPVRALYSAQRVLARARPPARAAPVAVHGRINDRRRRAGRGRLPAGSRFHQEPQALTGNHPPQAAELIANLKSESRALSPF